MAASSSIVSSPTVTGGASSNRGASVNQTQRFDFSRRRKLKPARRPTAGWQAPALLSSTSQLPSSEDTRSNIRMLLHEEVLKEVLKDEDDPHSTPLPTTPHSEGMQLPNVAADAAPAQLSPSKAAEVISLPRATTAQQPQPAAAIPSVSSSGPSLTSLCWEELDYADDGEEDEMDGIEAGTHPEPHWRQPVEDVSGTGMCEDMDLFDEFA